MGFMGLMAKLLGILVLASPSPVCPLLPCLLRLMAEGSPASLPPSSLWLCLLMHLSLEGLWLLPEKVWMGSHDAHT